MSKEEKTAASGRKSAPNGGSKEDKDMAKEENQVGLLKLYRYIQGPDYLYACCGVLGALGVGAVRPVASIIMGNLMNGLNSRSGVVAAVRVQSLNFVYLGIAALVTAALQASAWTLLAERQANHVRRAYLKALLRTDIGYYDLQPSGELVTRLAGDIILIQGAVGDKMGAALQNASTFITGLLIGFIKGWQLTLVILGCVPILAVSGAITASLLTSMSSKETKAYAKAGSMANEIFSTFRTVAAFNGEERAKQAYGGALGDSVRLGIRQKAVSGVGTGVAMIGMYGTFAICLWYATVLIRAGTFNGGTALTVFFSVLMGGSALGQSAPSVDAFNRGKGAAWKVFRVIDRVPTIDSASEAGEKPTEAVRGELELRGIEFSYPSRPDYPVFSGINLQIPAGKLAAFVGESGCGKSTVISLCLRFYDPTGGQVLLDGRDLRSLNLPWLRRQIGLVSQEPVLFACSVRENLLYGKPDATDAELVAACEQANAHGFISALAEKYESYVGERGTQLSGGQKQRIACARAILKDPKILLLDEATSALDTESEAHVQAALDKVMVGRTSVAVAHRLTTIRNADVIFVLKRGELVEQGSHDELVAADGAYAALLRLQGGIPQLARRSTAALAAAEDTQPPLPLADKARLPGGSAHDADADEPAAVGDAAPQNKYNAVAPAASAEEEEAISSDAQLAKSNGALLPATPSANSIRGRLASTASSSAESKAPAASDPPKQQDAPRASAVDDKKADDGPPPVPLWRLAEFAKPQLPYFAFALFFAMCQGVQMPVFALVMSHLFEVFFERDRKKMEDGAMFWALIMFGIGVASFFIVSGGSICSGKFSQELVMRLRRNAFAAAMRQEVAYFEDPKNNAGALSARLETDAALVRVLVADGVFSVAQAAATGLSGLIIAFTGGWRLSLVMCGLLPIIGSAMAVGLRVFVGLSKGTKDQFERATQVAQDAVGNIRTVASFTAEGRVLDLFERALAGPVVAARKKAVTSGASAGVAISLIPFSEAFIFYIGAIFIEKGYMTFQDMMQVFMALLMSASGVAMAMAQMGDVGAAKPATASVFALVDRMPVIDSEDPSGLKPDRCEGNVTLQAVHFAYPTRPGLTVLRGFSLELRVGEMAALVGESGSGKSTVVQLLLRYYDPQQGGVFLDGHDLRQLNLKWLRSQLGVVQQEPALFACSVRENIRYGREGASDAEVEEAAKAANVHDFVTGFPGGYDTEVGERGVQLSGGQKQRVAIARTMLRNPRVCILDEATSALDMASEKVVQAALEKLMQGRTTIAVAHRLSTIRHAHTIAVLSHGEMVEQGTHDALMAKEGVYARLMAIRQ